MPERLCCVKCGSPRLVLDIISHEDEKYKGYCSVCKGTDFAYYKIEEV